MDGQEDYLRVKGYTDIVMVVGNIIRTINRSIFGKSTTEPSAE